MKTSILFEAPNSVTQLGNSAEGIMVCSLEELDDLVLALDRAITHGHTVIEPDEMADFKKIRENVRALQGALRATTVKPRRRQSRHP